MMNGTKSNRRTTTAREEGYYGYKNYETWAVALCISNDQGYNQGYYQYWNEVAEEIKRQVAERGSSSEYWSPEDSIRLELAEMLKDYFQEQQPITESNVYAGLLNAALSKVDWNEVADSILAE